MPPALAPQRPRQRSRRQRHRWLSALCIALLLATGAQAKLQQKRLILVVDAALPATEPAPDSPPPFDTVRDELSTFIDTLSYRDDTGLIAYGHRSGQCPDIETLAPFAGGTDHRHLKKSVDSLSSAESRPLVTALAEALSQAKRDRQPKTVILIATGSDTCVPNPCQTLKDMGESGPDITVHAIGYQLGGRNEHLECIAQFGGGLHFSPDTPLQLASALERASTHITDTGNLVLTTTLRQKPWDASIRVYHWPTGDLVAGARTFTGGGTNPRKLRVPQGTYRVKIRPIGEDSDSPGHMLRTLEGIEIYPRATHSQRVELTDGELSVMTLSNNELVEAGVRIIDSESRRTVVQGHTRNHAIGNPRVFELPPGHYDVRVMARGQSRAQTHTNIPIAAGQRIERTFPHNTGTLSISISANGIPDDANIRIYDTSTGRNIANDRSYANPEPRTFELGAGLYSARIKSLNINGDAEREINGIAIESGKTVEHQFNYETARLRIDPQHIGATVDATLTVIDSSSGKTLVTARNFGRPQSFTLLPGRYKVRARAVNLRDTEVEERHIQLRAREPRDLVVDFVLTEPDKTQAQTDAL